MNWLSWLPGIFGGAKDLKESFWENAEKKGARKHLEGMADIERDVSVLSQFSAEFHERKNRSWWDSFVDGLNRLPRPALTIAILSFFILAPLNPQKFLEIAKAYELMPAGYWALLSVIIGFYFGGRMQLKSQDMTVKGDAVKAAKDLIAMRQDFRQLETEEDPVEEKLYTAAVNQGNRPNQNKVVYEWRQHQEVKKLQASSNSSSANSSDGSELDEDLFDDY